MWDGQVRDDKYKTMIDTEFPPIRVIQINDQCHSEGNFRAAFRSVQKLISFGYWGNRTYKPIISNRSQDISTWKGQLIQFAGCRENNYSYGSATGGTWTQSLLAAYDDGLTWRGWFDAAAKRMPSNQSPQWVEYGNVTDDFRYGKVLR